MIFLSNKKIHKLYIKGYFITKNSFVAEVTFNSFIDILQEFLLDFKQRSIPFRKHLVCKTLSLLKGFQ